MASFIFHNSFHLFFLLVTTLFWVIMRSFIRDAFYLWCCLLLVMCINQKLINYTKPNPRTSHKEFDLHPRKIFSIPFLALSLRMKGYCVGCYPILRILRCPFILSTAFSTHLEVNTMSFWVGMSLYFKYFLNVLDFLWYLGQLNVYSDHKAPY